MYFILTDLLPLRGKVQICREAVEGGPSMPRSRIAADGKEIGVGPAGITGPVITNSDPLCSLPR